MFKGFWKRFTTGIFSPFKDHYYIIEGAQYYFVYRVNFFIHIRIASKPTLESAKKALREDKLNRNKTIVYKE